MRPIQAIRRMWRMLTRRRADEAVLDEEIEAHLDFLREQLIRTGYSPEEARAAAIRQFGNRGRIHDEARDAFLFGGPELFVRDVGYALRALRRSPALVLVSVLSLGLGIGPNLIFHSAVRSVFFTLPTATDPSVWSGFGRTVTATLLTPYSRRSVLSVWSPILRGIERCRSIGVTATLPARCLPSL